MSLFFKEKRPVAPVWWARVAILTIATLGCLAAGAAVAQDSPAPDALIAQGRALYRGSQVWRQPPMLHGVALVAGTNACVACHGTRGEARSEAGVAVPAIQWQQLVQPTPTRPAYSDAAQVLRALTEGHTSGGRPLAAPMPRFALDTLEQQALLAYLGVLGTEADTVPGIGAQRIVLGSVLPLGGPQAATGAAIQAALLRRMELVNAAGGIFGRRLELVVADAGPDAASALAAADALVRSGQAFALVASLLPAPDAALRHTLARHETALVATLGMPVIQPRDALVSWLLPGLAQQAQELIAELQRACQGPHGAAGTVRVLHLRSGALNGATFTAPGASGAPSLQWVPIADAADIAGLRSALRHAGAGPTVVLLPPALAEAARAELVAQNVGAPVPCLGTLAALSGAPAAARPGLRELVVLPMPPVPVEEGTNTRTALWPLLADSALVTTAEALARAGRQLDTAKLVAALDTLHGFAPRPGWVLDFSAQRRHGFDVSYLWKEALP